MAQATANTLGYEVQLMLSKAEARTLRIIFANVGGHDEETARGYADDVKRALVGAMQSVGDYFDPVPGPKDSYTETSFSTLYLNKASKEAVDSD